MRVAMAIQQLGLFCCGLMLASTPTAGATWNRHTIDNTSRGADGVRVDDINKDGLPDLVTGWEEGGLVRVYLHPGANKSKQPWPAVTVGRVDTPEDAVFADVDGDGQLDVVSSCEGTHRTAYVHWAPSDPKSLLDESSWTTKPIPVTAGIQQWMFCSPMDVDGKNGPDLVLGSKDRNASISWLEAPNDNPRDLKNWKLHRIYDATWIMSLIAHDMDEDGDLDVLFSDRKPPGSGVKWIENPNEPNEKFRPWKTHLIGGREQEVMFIDLLRGNNLNSTRIGAAVKPGQLVGWAPQSAYDWNEAGRHSVSTNIGGAKAVKIIDVNLDDRLDVVFTCEAATEGKSGVVWLERTASGDTIERDISGPEGIKFDRIEALDLDADGDLDVITCEERDNLGVVWYENPTR